MREIEKIRQIADFFLQGRIGEANSQWGRLVADFKKLLLQMDADQKSRVTLLMKKILEQQSMEDWVGMADSLRYELVALLVEDFRD